MEVKAGDSWIPLVDCHELQRAVCYTDTIIVGFRLEQVTWLEIQERRKKDPTLRGLPLCCAFLDDRLEFWPTLDRKAELKVAYTVLKQI